MMNRNVKICAGEMPLLSSSLVNTNVLPQMATTVSATRWAVSRLPVVSIEVFVA